MTRALVLKALSTKTVHVTMVSFVFFVFLAIAMPAPAKAATLTDSQLQSVVDLLKSFSVEADVISKVEGALRGRVSTSSMGVKKGTPEQANLGASQCAHLLRTLRRGHQGEDVKELQKFLRNHGYLSEEASGYFGALTEEALKKLQAKEGIANSGDANTTGYGALGPKTRNLIFARCKDIVKQHISPNMGTSTSNASAPTCTLTASKSEIASGESVTLTWTSTNAKYASRRGGGIGPAEGSITLQPTESKTYVKTVYGKGGTTATCTTDVKVGTTTSSSAREIVFYSNNLAGQVVAAALSAPGNLLAQLFNFKPRNQQMEKNEKMFRELKQRNMERGMMASSTKPGKPYMGSTTPEKGRKDVPPGLEKNNFPGASRCAFLMRSLKKGSVGSDVQQLQEYLQSTGDLKTKADGMFGSSTEEALKKAQKRHNIVSSGNASTTGYGAFGPKTRQILMMHCKALLERKQDGNNASTTSSAPKPSCTLSASKNEVATGEVIKLTWTSTNATFASMPGGDKGPANGSIEIAPAESVTYQKRVYGPGGEGTCQVVVTVTGDTTTPEVKVVRESMLDEMFEDAGQSLASVITAYFGLFGIEF